MAKRKTNRAPFDLRWAFFLAYCSVGIQFLLTGKLPLQKKKKAKKITRKPKTTSKKKGG